MNGLVKDLTGLIGESKVLFQPEDLLAYANDATHYFRTQPPDAVVLPTSTEEISRVLSYAYEHYIPVTPRGAGSGLSGGATPVKGGIVVDTKRMNRIVEIDRANMTATVEGGVVLQNFHRAVEKTGLFYPPDPQSMSVCTMGANVATRAGGPRGVKYGTTGNYVTGLEVVLPDGSVIKTGGKFVKQSVGYDLTRLMTGSEGTLGIITKVHVRLLTLPPETRTMVVVCESLDQAAEIVSEIIARGAVPSMMEFMIKLAVTVMNTFVFPPLPTDGEAYLLMEIDGTAAQVEHDAETIKAICRDMKAREIREVEDERVARVYWKARSAMYPFIMTIFKRAITEDITVPRSRIPDLVRAIQEIAASVGIMIGLAGHAGDGNMHPTVLQSEINEEIAAKAKQAIDMLVRRGLELGGTISGEHGIGIHKQEYLDWELDQVQIDLMKRIKAAFDPRGIMNPGKIWVEGGQQ
ncbi:MAG TPA: FAD-linked oxidase C-terminal domain-containing protein [Syntrophomonadaceae bacterium]|nr:FAD-linked oxidase C-terminal domain-containing protein [Syntrophomonadaceae bacterium]HPU48487.1 FAD-linked oxidase C-terminal domain-containing protein [Syntrophomonadaceae bacterium]